ncbi:MAG: acetyl-CoA carboxylase biotin carboxyl carrier protein [Clostridia bacterium]|nr:acetyl-CoA carboxylase biotin carboxyl carrier protein [Clostridia bacterium]
MEYENIKKLMEDMGNSKLSAIDIDFPDGTKISMKKEDTKIVERVVSQKNQEIQEEIVNQKEKTIEDKEEGNIVKSPMVGTFYMKPAPNAKPYVEVGQKVKKGDVLCIIEAMKLMNEIESEFDGEIAEILLKDGDMVEFGKPLFRIK